MTIVPGIDVSRYQGTVNWKAVADAGFRFAVVRATIWNVKVDETFETNWTGARNAGLLVSAYHVLKADVPAAAQIDFFAQALTGQSGTCRPCSISSAMTQADFCSRLPNPCGIACT